MDIKLTYKEFIVGGKYKVVDIPLMTEIGAIQHLAISRKDDKKIKGFKVLQEIKDTLYPHLQAIQIFPERTNLIDNANVYHLWVLGKKLPIDLTDLENYEIE